MLLSGTASLVLKSSEEAIIDSHFKMKLQYLQKLHDKTPRVVVHFLAGSLPAAALLHLRQLSLFSMITRIPTNILHRVASYVLTTAKDNSRSWFVHIKNLCSQYQLPHPITLLQSPMSKESFKSLAKSRVVDYWEQLLRSEAKHLTSLSYFNPHYMSLTKPHPIWTTCHSNTYEVCRAITQAKMLSGRYKTDRLLRHFSDNKEGLCQICTSNSFGSIEHLLLACPSLENHRVKLLSCLLYTSPSPRD